MERRSQSVCKVAQDLILQWNVALGFEEFAVEATRMFDLIPFETVRAAPKTSVRIHRSRLRSRILFARTNRGNFAKMHVNSGTTLRITKLVVYNREGCLIKVAHNLRIRSSFSCDLDEARESSAGADFWWHGVSRGVHYLEPRNSARFFQAPAFENVSFATLRHASYQRRRLSRSAFEGVEEQLLYCRTSAGRYAKLIVEWGQTLIVRRLEVFNQNGTRHLRRSNLQVPSSYSIDLDSGSIHSGRKDLWWRGVNATTYYLEPRNGTALSCESYFRFEKYLSLLNRRSLQNRMLFQNQQGTHNYRSWPESRQLLLKECLYLRDTEAPLPVSGPPTTDALGYMNECDAEKIYVAHVAQSLWADATRAVNWRLSHANVATLEHLFDSRKLFRFAEGRGHRFDFSVMGAVTQWDPVLAFRFLSDEGLLAADHWRTIRNLADWCRANLIHITGYAYDSDGGPFSSQTEQWQHIYGYGGLPLVERMIHPLPGRRHITHGCWGTSGFLAAVLRTVNIPVRHGRSNFSGNSHSRPECFSVAKSLAHGDDLYNGWVRLGQNNVPIGEVFWDHADLQAQVDHPSPRPGMTVPETGSFHHRQRLIQLAVQHKTNNLLRLRCQDLGTGNTGSASQLWQNLNPYYTDAELAVIAQACDDALDAIPGGCSGL